MIGQISIIILEHISDAQPVYCPQGGNRISWHFRSNHTRSPLCGDAIIPTGEVENDNAMCYAVDENPPQSNDD